MKANRKKGLARKGSLTKQYVILKNKGIAKDANEKTCETRFYKKYENLVNPVELVKRYVES